MLALGVFVIEHIIFNIIFSIFALLFSFPLVCCATGAPTATCVTVHVLKITYIDSCVTPVEIDAGIQPGMEPPTLAAPLTCCSNCTATS